MSTAGEIIKKQIRACDLFTGIDEQGLEKLAREAVFREYEPREMVFTEGVAGSHFFILLSGSVRVFKTSPEGKESTIKIIHQGEFFAEVVLFHETRYPASAVATEPTSVLAINRDSFQEMVSSNDSRNAFISGLFEKLRFLTEQIHYLTSHDVEERFFRFIADTYGKKHRYTITLQKKDVASAIGTIPETFSRLLLRLTRRGIITWKENTLIVKEGFWEIDL